jgi:dipeptidyl aminopeptidase/acylaminoacyl peptidase
MIDFHGSTGYGQAFTDSISGHWGDRPLEDLQKGWAHVPAPVPDPGRQRACALGGSYGGYMVNWIAGAGTSPGAASSATPASSTTAPWATRPRSCGSPSTRTRACPGSARRTTRSSIPVNHVQNWKKPILVTQGAQDFRIPYSQSIGAFTAAQRKGVESRYLHFPDENHWILKPQNSVQWHETVEAWLDRHTSTSPPTTCRSARAGRAVRSAGRTRARW